jgi:hypothetical protein
VALFLARSVISFPLSLSLPLNPSYADRPGAAGSSSKGNKRQKPSKQEALKAATEKQQKLADAAARQDKVCLCGFVFVVVVMELLCVVCLAPVLGWVWAAVAAF